MSRQATVDLMNGFLDAFNGHDLDSIMEYFADDCVFYMPRGARPRGDRYAGKEEVRAGLAKRLEGIPDVHYGEDRHWACGDFGVSEWTLTGTSISGKDLEVRGVDLLEFADGRFRAKIPSGRSWSDVATAMNDGQFQRFLNGPQGGCDEQTAGGTDCTDVVGLCGGPAERVSSSG